VAQPADVFISYSREDKDRVLELAGKLRAAGVSLWIDQGSIDGATLWGEEIVNALDHAKVLLLAVTASAARSHNVAKEVVLFSERKGHILPVHLEQTTIPPSLKYPLAGIQHIEYFHGDPDENLKTILRSLERAGASIAPPKETKPTPPREEQHQRPAVAQAGHAEAVIERGALAVLPFENISTDQETDYFSDGLTEELIARLSLVSEIELISRWASMQYKGRKPDIHAIGTELSARRLFDSDISLIAVEYRQVQRHLRPVGSHVGRIARKTWSERQGWKLSQNGASELLVLGTVAELQCNQIRPPGASTR
jgi:TolB-like protein